MTRIIRNIPRKKVPSVPTENEQKATVVSYNNKQKRNNKNIFLWLPLSFTLAYGSVSFILLEPNIASWPISARLFLLVYFGWLVYISKLAKNNFRFIGLLFLSGITSYVFFSFLFFCALPTEWSNINRCQSVFIFSWMASSFAYPVDDIFDRFFWPVIYFMGQCIFFFPFIISIL
jgi:hypothetical protein